MKRMILRAASAALLLFASWPVNADTAIPPSQNGYPFFVVSSCGNVSLTAGVWAPGFEDTTGKQCSSATGATTQAVTEADGANTTLGSKADTANAAAGSTAMSVFRQLHADLIAPTPDASYTVTATSAAPLIGTGTDQTTGSISTAGYSSISVQATAGAGTIVYETSGDNVNWTQEACINSNSVGSVPGLTSLGLPNTLAVICPRVLRYFRVRASVYTSGTVTATMTGSVAPAPPNANYVAQGPAGASAWPMSSATNAGTGGVASLGRLVSSAATTNATLVKSSAGRVYKVYACNTTTSDRYVRLFNKATAPVPGTDSVFWSRVLPRSATSGAPLCQSFDLSDVGYYLSAGIGYDVTAGSADTDATATAAGDVVHLSVEYQ